MRALARGRLCAHADATSGPASTIPLAAVNRDYPIMFGTLYLYTLVGLLLNVVSDLAYVAIDPRIDFARRDG